MTSTPTPPTPSTIQRDISSSLLISVLTSGRPHLDVVASCNAATQAFHVPHVFHRGGLYLDDNRTEQILDFLHNWPGRDHLLLVDDDIEFTPDAVSRLFYYGHDVAWASGQYANFDAHAGQIVCAYTLDHFTRRGPDTDPTTLPVFEDGAMFHPIPLADAPLFPTFVDSVGAGFTLLSRAFLLDMQAKFPPPNPWYDEPVIKGWVDPAHPELAGSRNVHLGEDHGFALKASSMGVQCLLAPVDVIHHKVTRLSIPALVEARARLDAAAAEEAVTPRAS